VNLIDNHAEQALSRLLYQYKNKPNIEKLIRALCGEVKRIEDAIYGVFIGRALMSAVGAQLDGLGRVLKLERGALSDEEYRIWLRGRILALRSSGTPDELIELVNTLVDCGSRFQEYFPAAAYVRLLDSVGSAREQLIGLIAEAKSAGVEVVVQWAEAPEATTLRCYGNEVVAAETTLASASSIGATLLSLEMDVYTDWPVESVVAAGVGLWTANLEWCRFVSRPSAHGLLMMYPLKYKHDAGDTVVLVTDVGLGDTRNVGEGGLIPGATNARK